MERIFPFLIAFQKAHKALVMSPGYLHHSAFGRSHCAVNFVFHFESESYPLTMEAAMFGLFTIGSRPF